MEDMMRQEERLWKFRSSFNEQYKRLKRAAQVYSTILGPYSWQLQNSRQAWAVAITTMRRLSRLESSPKLMEALCFLCASRAVAETAQDTRDAYISAFSQDLSNWGEILPEIKEISGFMWGINWDFVPKPQPQSSSEIEQLRESVAALLVKTNEMFSLGHHSPHEKTTDGGGGSSQQCLGNIEQAPRAMKPPDPLATAQRQKIPPDRNCHREGTPAPLTNVVVLVTSVIFALIVHFMLGLVWFSLPTILGLPNPWHIPISEAEVNFQTTPLEPIPGQIPTPSHPVTDPITYNSPFSADTHNISFTSPFSGAPL
ncbi:hypothetical protein F4802DRAFT_416362 [Xylaria palmicola]|nr:hypothetical protein F4802DRAFT_416362 [Xylaria palmicola]